MANASKEICRDHHIKIRVSKEEKELWEKYAHELGIMPTRLARNILMLEAESLLNKFVNNPICKAYIHYKKVTKDKEFLERLKTE